MSSSDSPHVTVLREECLEALAIRPEGFYIDCTAGGGGHSAAIAARLTSGHLLALDRDPAAIELTSRRRSEEHTSELQSRQYLVCRLLLEKKKKTTRRSCISNTNEDTSATSR